MRCQRLATVATFDCMGLGAKPRRWALLTRDTRKGIKASIIKIWLFVYLTIFHFKLQFCWLGRKNIFVPGRSVVVYPSYATERSVVMELPIFEA